MDFLQLRGSGVVVVVVVVVVVKDEEGKGLRCGLHDHVMMRECVRQSEFRG